MINKLSFIHAADLHLDSPFKGLTHIPQTIFNQVQESTFTALDNLVSSAINKEVDFVLLVGDLFDNERQSLKAQVRLRNACETLAKHKIQVYISYGNHDYINGNMHPMTYPENVHIFPNENISSFTFEKDHKKMASIYGFSYENRAVTKNKSLEYSVVDKTIPFHIATLHGSVHGNQEHDPYAPFQLSHLQENNFDYWALGHIHKREQLSNYPPIVYPGNTQGRHRNESGSKGCYYVELTEKDINLEFIPLQSIEFAAVTIDVTHCQTIADIENKLDQVNKNKSSSQLIHVTFRSENQNIVAYDNEGLLEELIEITNEFSLKDDLWTFIYDYRLQLDEIPVIDYGEFFISEVVHALDNLQTEKELNDLYTHPQGRRFLEKAMDEDIKEQAKQYLLYELLKVGR